MHIHEYINYTELIINFTEHTTEQHIQQKFTCPACADGVPTKRSCDVCHKSVHHIDECSLGIGEEGYNQKRVCHDCNNKKVTPILLGSRETETWMGQQDLENVSLGLYLRNNPLKIKEGLMWEKHRKLPILKNANHESLKAVKVDGKQVSLKNTCSFDSIFQVLLTAVVDNETLKEEVTCNSNSSKINIIKN